MVKFEGEREFNAGIDAWLEAVEQLAVETLRGFTVRLFNKVIENSPQFSGNAVANWRYSVNGEDTSSTDFFKELFKGRNEESFPAMIEAYSKSNRNDGAEWVAKEISAGRELGVTKLSDVIYISNSVDYADWLAQATESDLRAQNHVGHVISHSTKDVLQGHLVITTDKALALSRERIV